jgi:phage-related protein
VHEEQPGPWNVDFYREDDGSLPVMKWIDRLPEDVRGKVIARIDMLRQGGPTLDYPYTSQIEGKLREARLRVGKTRYRVLYFFDENRTAILLHGFTKNTAAVEESDKRVARSRLIRHEGRIESKRSGKASNAKGRNA